MKTTPIEIHQESPSTQFLLLRKIIESTNNPHTFNRLVDSGFAPEQLKTLSQLPTSQLNKLCQLVEFEIEFFIDPVVLERCLEVILGSNKDLPRYFLQHGAPHHLLKALFGLTKTEIAQLRREVPNGTEVCSQGGRPKMPPENTREDIERDWMILAESAMNLTEQYFKLHHKYPQYSIAALHTVVMENL